MIKTVVLTIALFVVSGFSKVSACTRFVYNGPDNTVITARTMDFRVDIPTDLWVFPRGMKRTGLTGKNTIEWVSKYGTLSASSFDCAVADGMNEKGLVANVLWLVETQYPEFDGSRPGLSVALWVQYVLENFASVAEAVTALSKEEFVVVSDKIPGTEIFVPLHMSLSDSSGDSAILEYIEGRLVIHHDKSYTVMTNSPQFEKQLTLNDYWQEIGGMTMLPGTNRAADRFVRASFYVNAIPQKSDLKKALAAVFSVIRNCSVPYGISSPDQPNISTTQWRAVSDHKNSVYYLDRVTEPNVFWVDLKKLNFSEGAPVMKLGASKGEVYFGESSEKFQPAEPLVFLGIEE